MFVFGKVCFFGCFSFVFWIDFVFSDKSCFLNRFFDSVHFDGCIHALSLSIVNCVKGVAQLMLAGCPLCRKSLPSRVFATDWRINITHATTLSGKNCCFVHSKLCTSYPAKQDASQTFARTKLRPGPDLYFADCPFVHNKLVQDPCQAGCDNLCLGRKS